jgi:CRP-like cAMP-binding protein
MASFVDATLRDIDRHLAELKDEVKRLEAARAALTGSRRGPGRPPSANSDGASDSSAGSTRRGGTRRRPGRPRGRRAGNTRSAQALELVRNRPGITIPQIAEELGIEPNYLYRVMPRLVSEGEIRRDGQGWFAGAGDPAATGESPDGAHED